MMKKYDLSTLSTFLPNLRSLYDVLSDQKGYYLPDFGSRALTHSYLLQVVKNEVFTLKQQDVRIGKLRRTASRAELIEALQKYSELPLGVNDKDRPPNKQWLVNCLHTLCPKHELFTYQMTGAFRELPDDFFEGVALPGKKYKGRGLFKRTKEEKKADDLTNLKRRNVREGNNIQSMKKKIADLEEQLEKRILEEKIPEEKGVGMIIYPQEEGQGIVELWERKKQHLENEGYLVPIHARSQDILEQKDAETVIGIESQCEQKHLENEGCLVPIYAKSEEVVEQNYSEKETFIRTENQEEQKKHLEKDILFGLTETTQTGNQDDAKNEVYETA